MNKDEFKERVRETSWEKFCSSDEDKEDIIKGLLGFLSDSEGEIDKSYWKLDNNIVIQGTLYKSSFKVIPFLFLLLEMNLHPHGRKAIMELLVQLTYGSASDDVVVIWDKKETTLKNACRTQISSKIPTLLKELENTESLAREACMEILMGLCGYYPLWEKRILEMAATEQSEPIRSLMREALEEGYRAYYSDDFPP